MKKSVLFWISLFLTVAFCLRPPEAAGEAPFLTFPAVAPVTKTCRSLSFTLPASPASTVSFHCSDLVDPVTGHRLEAGRLTFLYGRQIVGPGQPLILTPSPAGEPEPGSTREIELQINLLPSDPPGEYEGRLEAVLHHTPEKTEEIPLLVKVRVLPWIKLETASVQPAAFGSFSSFTDFTESSLTLNEPFKLLLATNAPWSLYLRAELTIAGQAPALPLRIKIGRPSKAGEVQKTLLANGPAQLVASGPPTVVGDGSVPAKYWTELYLSAFLNDWRQYPTGHYQLTFYFSGQTITP